jgi:ferredoxin
MAEMKQLVVDTEVCQGFGTCQAVAPELFQLNEQMIPVVLKVLETPQELAAAQEAVRLCPRKAIRLADF